MENVGAIEGSPEAAAAMPATDIGTGREDKRIRLTHDTKRVTFPRDGKKVKAHFWALENDYSRCWCVSGQDTYKEEIAYYRQRYGAMIEARNQVSIKNRHKDRIISAQDLHGRAHTCPEELAVQVGGRDGDGVPSAEVFEACIMKYLSWMRNWSREHGGCLHVLDAYVSKKKPYRAVIRRVWDCEGKDGIRKPSIRGALKAAGVPYPDPEAEESRFNNRKITFDRMSRETLCRYFEEAGILVNRETGIHTLRKALEVKEGTDMEEQCARDMLREIMEVEAQAPPMAESADIPGLLEGLDGGVLVPENVYRMLKIRKCLAGAYAAGRQAADRRLLDAFDEERKEQKAYAVQKGIREATELEYAGLRIGLLRCGYYAGGAIDEKGVEEFESIVQQFEDTGVSKP